MNLRLDRLATLYLVSPYLRLAPTRESSVPVLMYHSVTDEDEPRVHPYYRTTTHPAVFAAQLEYLRAQGYTTCALAEAARYLHGDTQTFAKPVVITFDDGYRDFYHHAYPLLKLYGFSATVFLSTAYIGESSLSFKGKDCLTWGEVRELSKEKILFGSHTATHPQLRELAISRIDEELLSSKNTIEDKLGCAVESFAYPYAFPQTDNDFRKVLRNSLHKAGYQNGVCTIVGRANRQSDRLFIERLPVNSCDDATLFSAKLAGAYDWISTLQRVSKMARKRPIILRPQA